MSDLARFNSTITNVRTQEYLTQVLGEKKNAFVNNVTALVANNKALQECEPLSIMYAATKATALDLPLDQNLGFAYVIPYKNNRENKTEAQFQLGYRGLVQLAMRSEQFRYINVTDVREGELKRHDRLTGNIEFDWVEDETKREKLKIIGYVGYFELVNGFKKMSYWTNEQLTNHGLRYSQTFASKNDYIKKNSKWATDFDAMAKKTVIKLLLSKYAPLSVDMQSAIKYDQAVIGENDSVRYVDNNSQANINAEQQQAAAERIKEALNANAVDAEIQAVDEETGELF